MTDYREDFAGILKQLSTFVGKRGDVFRSRAFKKAHENIAALTKPVTSKEDLENVNGVGPGVLKLFEEFKNTGKVELLEKEQNRAENVFADIYGVGPKKAKALVDKGIRSLEQLREQSDELNDIQKIGLKYYDDIQK